MNHKWKDDACTMCGITREMKTIRRHMAMVGSKDYYQYERRYVYYVNGKEETVRPDCKKPLLKPWKDEAGNITGYVHVCPGCNQDHYIQTSGNLRPRWDFDNNFQAPTFAPSVMVNYGLCGKICHYFIRGGKIEYLGDSTHKLAGKTVDMKPIRE